MKIELKELSMNDGREVYDFLMTLLKNENGFGNPCFGLEYKEFHNFLERAIEEARGIRLAKDRVPQTTYWLYVDDVIVGIGKLRTELTPSLKQRGGNIGYSIGREFREKGYAKILLAELLKKAKSKKLKRVLLTVNENNEASRKVIEINGGKLQDILNKSCRYWIKV